MMNQKKNNKGFSLAEIMVVVVIMIILFAVVAVNVVKNQKKVRQERYDSYAQTIYEAAQNRMTELYAAKGKNAFADYPADFSDGGVNFAVISNASGDKNIIFTADSISEELISQKWAVEFNPNNGFVYAAFYGDKQCSGLTDLAARSSWREKVDGLRNDAHVGYYGQLSPSQEYRPMEDKTCRITLINKDVLKAHIEVGIPEGMTTAAVYYSITSKSGSYSGSVETTGTFDLILDSLKDGEGFERFCTSGIKPGEDITVTVYASFEGAAVENTPPVTASANSLFETYDGASNTATVRYGRHLQNLGRIASMTDAVSVTDVIQDRSIDFTDASEDMWANADVYGLTDSLNSGNAWLEKHKYMPFVPIDNPSIDTYSSTNTSGSGCTITGLIVAGASDTPVSSNGGLFGTFSGSGITGVNLSGAYVNASGDAGALAGNIAGSARITNCMSYLLYPDYTADSDWTAVHMQWIKGGANAGALVGSASGTVQFTGCSGSSVVYAAGESGNAGGLFGSAGKALISNSYADSYVIGAGTSGGLGGTAGSGSTVNSSYSAGFLYEPGTAICTGYASPYFENAASVANSYSIFNYSLVTQAPVSSVPADNAYGSVSGDFVWYKEDDIDKREDFTTAYNIIPGRSTDLQPYEYPMVTRTLAGTSGSGSTELMHHYGDWNGISGFTIYFHTMGLDSAGNRTAVETKTVTVSSEESRKISDIVIGKELFDIYNNVSGNISLNLASTDNNTGWYTDSDCSTVITAEDLDRVISEDKHLYAEWRCAVSYSSSIGDFYNNGGIRVETPTSVLYGTKFADVSGTPSPAAFEPDKQEASLDAAGGQLKWYKSYDSSSCRWGTSFGASDPITQNTTAYAKWKCSLTFDPAESAISTTKYNLPELVDYGTTLGSLSGRYPSAGSFGVTDYRLDEDCWYNDADYHNISSEFRIPDSYRIVKNDTVYARWKCDIRYHSVIYKDISGMQEFVLAAEPVYYGSSVDLSLAAPLSEEFSNDALITGNKLQLTGKWYSTSPTDYRYNSDRLVNGKTVEVKEAKDVYGQWEIEVTYKTSSRQDNSVTTADRYVDTRSESEFVLYGTAYGDIVPSVLSAFTQTPFELDRDANNKVQWYSNDGLTAMISASGLVTASGNRTLYAKYDGIVLKTKQGTDTMHVYRFSPDVGMEHVLADYALTVGSIGNIVLDISGSAKIFSFDSWGIGTSATDFTPVFTSTGHSLAGFEKPDGIQVYTARWNEVVDYSEMASGTGNAKYGYTGLTAFSEAGGVYILCNANTGNGYKHSSAIGINSEGSLCSIEVPMEPSGGSSGNAFIPLVKTKKSNPVDKKTMWSIQRNGTGYYIHNVTADIYLGLDDSGKLTALDGGTDLSLAHAVWDISSTSGGTGTIKMTIPSGTWYINFSNGSVGQALSTSSSSSSKVYLYGTEYKSETVIN